MSTNKIKFNFNNINSNNNIITPTIFKAIIIIYIISKNNKNKLLATNKIIKPSHSIKSNNLYKQYLNPKSLNKSNHPLEHKSDKYLQNKSVL